MPTIIACTQHVPRAAQEISVARLQHYGNGPGEGTGPGSPAAFQADHKNVEMNTDSSLIPFKMLHGWYNDLLEIVRSLFRGYKQLPIGLIHLGTCEK